ncbi:MAG TPA: DinB family protein [Motilibacteraceae bacterium]|nr:DinB family protein [Motilibacteraceae bacterium]
MGLGADRVLELLEATTAHVRRLGADVPAERADASPPDGGWSMLEVLAHLRACADVWGASIDRILSEDEPTIRALNPRTYLPSTDYLTLAWHPSWQAFLGQREALLQRLLPLGEEQWRRAATVVGAGRPLRTTALDYAERLATHERSHVKQLHRLAAG